MTQSYGWNLQRLQHSRNNNKIKSVCVRCDAGMQSCRWWRGCLTSACAMAHQSQSGGARGPTRRTTALARSPATCCTTGVLARQPGERCHRLGQGWPPSTDYGRAATMSSAWLQSTRPAMSAFLRQYWQRPHADVCSNNNNNNSHDNVYGAVIMTKVIARVHAVHLMNADWAPGGRQHSDQASRFGLWVHRKLAAVIHIHHRHCYYYSDSFYHPTKGGRLAWDNIYVVKGAINQAFTALIVIEGITFDPMPLTMVQTAPKDVLKLFLVFLICMTLFNIFTE